MKNDKQILNEIAMKLGKVYTDKDNPPFKVVNEKVGLNIDDPFGMRADLKTKYPDLYKADDYMLPTTGVDAGTRFSNQITNKRTADLAKKFPDMYPGKTDLEKAQDFVKKPLKFEPRSFDTDSTTPSKAPGGVKKWWSSLDPMHRTAIQGLGAFGAYKAYKAYKDKKEREDESVHNESIDINEGPSYEYRKYTNNISKSTKAHQGAVLDLYELLRKKGLDKEATMLLDAFKKNLVTFKKTYDKIMRKLV